MDQSGDFIRQASVGATGNWALLIDGENVDAENASRILAPHPEAFAIRRVYGEIGVLHERRWIDVPELRVINAFRGRNSADILLVVEAMCLAQSGVRNFVIVSGDGGMIHLIRHLREVGCRVVVMAPKINCSAALRTAGHVFVELAEPVAAPVKAAKPTPTCGPATAKPVLPETSVAVRMENHVRNLVSQSKEEGVKVKEINTKARSTFPKCKESHISLEDWRRWLRARPNLFLLDPPGPTERVRLAPPPTP